MNLLLGEADITDSVDLLPSASSASASSSAPCVPADTPAEQPTAKRPSAQDKKKQQKKDAKATAKADATPDLASALPTPKRRVAKLLLSSSQSPPAESKAAALVPPPKRAKSEVGPNLASSTTMAIASPSAPTATSMPAAPVQLADLRPSVPLREFLQAPPDPPAFTPGISVMPPSRFMDYDPSWEDACNGSCGQSFENSMLSTIVGPSIAMDASVDSAFPSASELFGAASSSSVAMQASSVAATSEASQSAVASVAAPSTATDASVAAPSQASSSSVASVDAASEARPSSAESAAKGSVVAPVAEGAPSEAAVAKADSVGVPEILSSGFQAPRGAWLQTNDGMVRWTSALSPGFGGTVEGTWLVLGQTVTHVVKGLPLRILPAAIQAISPKYTAAGAGGAKTHPLLFDGIFVQHHGIAR